MCEASEKKTQSSGPRRLAFGKWGPAHLARGYFFLHFDKLPWRHGLEQGITDNRSPRGAPLATAEQEYEWFFPQGTKCVKVSSGSIQKSLSWVLLRRQHHHCCSSLYIHPTFVFVVLQLHHSSKASGRRTCSRCTKSCVCTNNRGYATHAVDVVIGLSAVTPPPRQTAGSPSDVHAVFDEATGGAQLRARAPFSLMGAMGNF